MTIDRYSRVVLTIIAMALVYLCVVLTPVPSVHAQVAGQRPGDYTGPAEVVIVGWRPAQGQPFPVQVTGTAAVQVMGEARVTGHVTTTQQENTSDRVVVAGWMERGSEGRGGLFRSLDASGPAGRGLPVTQTPIK